LSPIWSFFDCENYESRLMRSQHSGSFAEVMPWLGVLGESFPPSKGAAALTAAFEHCPNCDETRVAVAEASNRLTRMQESAIEMRVLPPKSAPLRASFFRQQSCRLTAREMASSCLELSGLPQSTVRSLIGEVFIVPAEWPGSCRPHSFCCFRHQQGLDKN